LIVVNPRETKLEQYAAHGIRYAYGEEAATINGLLKSDAAKAAADAIRSAENLLVFYGSDGLGLEGSTALAAACAGLLSGTGHAGKANSGLIGVWPRANDQGAWELGFRPAADLAEAFKGKVVYIAGADPAGDDPKLKEALKGAKAVIVQELFLTETARLANVVLPAQSYTEREGSVTSAERRVQRYYPAILPVGEAGADFSITSAIAMELGMEMEGQIAARVMDRLAASEAAFADLSFQKLAETTDQWPIVGRSDLYYGGTTYENKQGLGATLPLVNIKAKTAREAEKGEPIHPDESHFVAVPVTQLYDNGITVRTTALLQSLIGEASLRVHPDTAVRFGLHDSVKIHLDGFESSIKVVLDETVPASVGLVPRSMGVPLHGPAVVSVKAPTQEGQP
jgi:NADH-quinone oxidoreductase subunit G